MLNMFYLLCHLIPKTEDTDAQRGLVTSLRTHSQYLGKGGGKPKAGTISHGILQAAHLTQDAGTATQQPDRDQGPNPGAKEGHIRFQ